MYLLGTMLIVTALALAIMASVSYVLVIRGNGAALNYGRVGVYGALVGVVAVVLLLIMVFVARRYDIQYVNDYSSNELEFAFRVASLWAGQPGSFVIWALWGMLFAPLLIRRTRQYEPYALTVYMAVHAVLLFFMLIFNPFTPTMENGQLVTPIDGKGLNPLLHNPWMVIHPPMLFMGYALMAVPFALAVAGLWRRDYDNWAPMAMPWTLSAWCFLGTALLLGGYWAYETLGWGGYWGWDPVENSSLVPWIMATALLHCLLLQRTHGGLRRTNFVLAIMAYVSVFYASYLTRSGLLSNFSVHSFVAEGLKEIMAVALLAMLLGTLALAALRWRDIPIRPLSDKLLSRDSLFVLGTLTLLVLAVLIGLGTSVPLISGIPNVGHQLQSWMGAAFEIDDGTLLNPQAEPLTDGRFSLTPEFYQRTTPPLALVILLLLILGPLLGWRDTNVRHLMRALRWPGLAAILVTVASILILGVRDPMDLGYIGLGVFALGTNLVMVIRTLKSGVLRIGGYLAHMGLAVLLIGVVGSIAYATPDERLVLEQGETQGMFGYNMTFNGWKQTPDGKGVLDVSVTRGGQTFAAQPQLWFNQRMGATMATPAIWGKPLQDLYVTPAEYLPAENPNAPVLGRGDTFNAGPYELRFIGFDVDRDRMQSGEAFEVGAQLQVRYEGQDATVTPKVEVQPNATELVDVPVELPGGHVIHLQNIDVNRQMVALQIDGLNLPVTKAKAVLTVSVKPLVNLVWAGVIIGVLGGAIAAIRRALELNARLDGARQPLPRGLAGLARLTGLLSIFRH
jgi:cytochrome c-type biogenesis protein CcmF